MPYLLLDFDVGHDNRGLDIQAAYQAGGSLTAPPGGRVEAAAGVSTGACESAGDPTGKPLSNSATNTKLRQMRDKARLFIYLSLN